MWCEMGKQNAQAKKVHCFVVPLIRYNIVDKGGTVVNASVSNQWCA